MKYDENITIRDEELNNLVNKLPNDPIFVLIKTFIIPQIPKMGIWGIFNLSGINLFE